MKNAFVLCLQSSVRGALGDRALPLVLAAVVGATVLPTFGSAKRIDLSSCFVSTNYLKEKYVFKRNPMGYFRDRDAVAYSNCVTSLKNVQVGELYTMRWDDNADYHMDEMLESGCSNSIGAIEWLCKNVLNDAPIPPPVTDLGCSAFAATNALGQQLAERNFDYRYRMTHALVYVPKSEKFHRPHASVSSVDCGWVGYDIGGLDNCTNDLSYVALFPHIPLDGMNDQGLMVTVLSLDGRPRPGAAPGDKSWMTGQYYPDRTNIVTTAAIRYLLDNADSTETGINMLTNNFNMFQAIGGGIPIVANYHFYLCDKSGDTRVVEWLPPAKEGDSWTPWVTNATSVSNFYFYDGYGHGSNRWEIMRHALARQNGHLEVTDAMHLARAVAQHKGAEQTSWTHWSIVYNLADLTAHIATLGNYDEIFPYRLVPDAPSDWTTEAPKSARPVVETNLPPFEATAQAGAVYRLTADAVVRDKPGQPSSFDGAVVSAVDRMGCTYDVPNETIHAVVCETGTCQAVFYVDMSGKEAKHWPECVIAGVNEKGLMARVARFRNAGSDGSLSPSVVLRDRLLVCATAAEAVADIPGRPLSGDTGLVFTDARGNVAVWPAGSELPTDDASEMVRNSLDLRKGIYETDGGGRGQFDELPGLLRLASSADTKAVVSMGYGHLDVMLPESNVVWRVAMEGVSVPAYGVIAEPPAVAHTTATLTYTNGSAVATNNQGRLVAETNAMLRVAYTADPGYCFAGGAKSWTRDFSVGDTATTPPAPETAPASQGITLWLQNVYTNRFTVMCETVDAIPDLRLQYGEDYATSVGMTSTNGLKEGTFVCKACVTVEDAEGATVPYRLAVGTVPIAGTEGTVRLWKNEGAAFSCAVWGDNQEGVQKYDWGFDDTDERYRCIRSMFGHMAGQKPDFGFTTGDMSSCADYDKEIEPGELRGAADLFAGKVPFHLVWGNHDCIGSFFGESYTNAVQRYFESAASEEDGWFHVYRNDVLFIGVHWVGDAETRYDAITNGIAQLLATERAKNAKFRIIMQHAPVFLECWNVLPKTEWFSDTRLLDVAKAGGVDLVFSGHTHAYERIERDGLVQVVNGGMGYLDHGERWYNNYGSDTKVGGHLNTPLLWARQSSSSLASRPSSLAPAQPVRMGCFHGYGMLSVEGNTLTYKAHAFNADGSYIGVADSFSLSSKTVDAASMPRQNKDEASFAVRGEDAASMLTSPVNNATWKAYEDAQGEAWEIPEGQTGTDPVVNVSKAQIERFCAALNAGGLHNYRLPTVKELTAVFGGNLRRDVSEWTSDVDPDSGWCRILGGNNKAVDFTWCREFDKPAMASPDCHANYLGFRVVDAPTPVVPETAMDKALAALAEIENPAAIYEWNPLEGRLEDITSDWTDETLTSKYTYKNPVIFTGKGDVAYRVRREMVFGGGVAAPNATSLDLSHVIGIASKPLTIKGEFRGGVAADEWRFFLKCDALTLDNVTYRGQVFNAVTDNRAISLVGTNDFSGAVMSVGIDKLLIDPGERFVTNLVADAAAMLWLRRLDFAIRNVAEEVIARDTASFVVGENVTLVTTEDVLFGIKGATLTVDGALDAVGVDIAGHLMGLLPQEASLLGTGKVRTTHFGMCDKSTLYVGVPQVTLLSSVPYRTYADSTDVCDVRWLQGRAPDYAADDGRDWLYNHAIAGKVCPDEAAEADVDLFYVYPTLAGGEQIVIDGFRGIDDAAMRGTATNYQTAVGAYVGSGRCFADMTHVYAPYYRQATTATAYDCATNATGGVTANAKYLQTLCEGPAYADVTNALSTYFARWNNGRRLILAAHSQGSALLRLVMENYFILPENRDKARLIVCSYQIGFGIGQSSVNAITDATGVKFAEKSDDTNVIVSYNTMSKETTDYSILLPPDTLAINPITWTTGTDLADKSLNRGALTNALDGSADVIVPHLYGARVADTGAKRGEVVVCAELVGHELAEGLFGEGSLHGNDYGAFWENLHGNCYDRIAAATGKPPVVGKPTDYEQAENWMSRPETAEKPVDVFYLYPTCVPGTCRTLIGEIEDGMKAAANEHFRKGPSTFESYANVYAPYYRQGSGIALISDLTPDGIQRFGSTHVVKTDVFAALDWYFANRNPGAERPFVLASHSQGSANMKNVLEEYFVGEKSTYTNKLVAAYVLGYKITPAWCEKVGIPFATGESDAGVVITWNAEGPGEASDNFLTADPTQLAINPINWKTDATDAPKADNLGSVITNAQGQLYNTGTPGVTGARLQAGRAGAVIVDASGDIPVGISPGFGTKSYHFEDWGFFHDNIGANGRVRYESWHVARGAVVPGRKPPVFETYEAASNAAEKAYVLRPNGEVEQVVGAVEYDAMFEVSAVPQEGASSDWTLSIGLTSTVSNEVQTAIDAAMPSLVETVTNAMPTAIVSTQAGLYYGITAAAEVGDVKGATIPEKEWKLGTGHAAQPVSGTRPATDKSFYILKADILPRQ